MYVNDDIDYLRYLYGKEIIIFGAGMDGKNICARLRGGSRVIAFCDNDERKQGQKFCGISVVSFEELLKVNHENLMIVICSRYERDIRRQLLDSKVYNFISSSQIDFGGGEEYYDEQYFAYQKEMGKFGGKVKAAIFHPYIKEEMTVVEFGSGGGYLLENLRVREKLGIEINDAARAEAKEIGIDSVKSISDVPDGYADIIISTSVLEHVENPFGVLKELRNKLKDDGMIVFHVPNESCDMEYVRSEVNNHLYTWNCLTLGNLFKAAGYFVHSVQRVQEVWPKNFLEIEKEVSCELFEVLCGIGGRAFNENRCIIVAYK